MAVNRTNAVVGVIGAIVVVLFGWWLFSAINETKERGVAAKRQEEQARQAQLELEQAANVQAQKKREEVVARLGAGKVPQWTREDATLRLVALRGVDPLRENQDLCPAVKKLRSRSPRDEFEFRERERAEAQAFEKCAADIKARAGPMPDVMWVSCSIDPESVTYDFGMQVFKADFVNRHCALVDDKMWHVKGLAEELVVQGAAPAGAFRDGLMWLAVDEPRARQFKQRLRRARVELAFEPWSFGPTPLMKSESFGGIRFAPTTLEAFGGKALAFRIVDGARDVIVDWTLYGTDLDGKESRAKILIEPVITKTEAQQLREKMSAKDLNMLRGELAKAHARRRWSGTQQTRFIEICLKTQAEDPSVNRRVCKCNLEMVMSRFASLGAWGDDITEHRGQKADPELAGWFGSCSAAFGN